MDPNTANILLSLSENNREVTNSEEDQHHPDHPDRFDYWPQILCREGLTGRCYYEVETSGEVYVGLTLKGIGRKGVGPDSLIGGNDKSWSLECSGNRYTARHNDKETTIPVPISSSRVGVYLDGPAGTLSFYQISSNTLTHLFTFHHSSFSEPLYPGFWVGRVGSSVSLCQLE